MADACRHGHRRHAEAHGSCSHPALHRTAAALLGSSLVKRLEELGIGRPSTYASTLSTLIDRDYVKLEQKRFIAESQGRLVNAFLVNFFTKYVEYDFTADLEAKLDDVSDGEIDWKQVLRDFWNDFIAKIEDSKKLTIEEVLAALNTLLADYVFGPVKDGKDPRKCPACATGTLGIRTGRFGPYIACSNYPECNHKAQIGKQASDGGVDTGDMQFPKILGKDPAGGEDISLKKGPYGVYVQIGEGKKPKRAGLLKHMNAAEMDLEKALSLLSLPRELGLHPDTKKPIVANNGRFGPYLLHDGKFTTLPKEEDVLTIGINRAVEVLANAPEKKGGRGGNFAPLRVLGKHPDDDQQVAVYNGRYGAYVKHGKTNATLPKDADPQTYTLEEAIPLLAARAGAGKKKKPAAKKAAKKKTG
jgi:DNA topoisomerase-1